MISDPDFLRARASVDDGNAWQRVLPPGFDGLQQALTQETASCTRDDLDVCGITLRITGDERLAQVTGVVLGTPLRILLLVTVALIVRRVLHRLIDRLAYAGVDRMAGRPAFVVRATRPGPQAALAAKFWIDQRTGLVLARRKGG